MLRQIKKSLFAVLMMPFVIHCGHSHTYESTRTEEFDYTIKNNTNQTVTLRFDASYGDYCDYSTYKVSVDPDTAEDLSASFTGCRSQGGSELSIIKWSLQNGESGYFYNPDAHRDTIICERSMCYLY